MERLYTERELQDARADAFDMGYKFSQGEPIKPIMHSPAKVKEIFGASYRESRV